MWDDLINRLIRYPGAIMMRVRIARLRLIGVRIGRKCWIRRIDVPRNPWDIELEDGVALDDRVVLLITGHRQGKLRLTIGSRTYVNRFTIFAAAEEIRIGRNCLIGPYCYITDLDHGTGPGLMADQELETAPVRIGNNVWIGAGVTILRGVEIGDGAVVGAGAVVTRSVRENEKIAGVPARAIGQRVAEGSELR